MINNLNAHIAVSILALGLAWSTIIPKPNFLETSKSIYKGLVGFWWTKIVGNNNAVHNLWKKTNLGRLEIAASFQYM